MTIERTVGWRRVLLSLRRVTHHPYTNLAIGVVLVLCGVLEGVETVFEKLLGFEVRAHHGVAFFGLSQVLMAGVHILSGLEDIEGATLVKEVEGVESSLEQTPPA